jgi:D-psicose/D-tagatose/L-ribulose 3-epimerase
MKYGVHTFLWTRTFDESNLNLLPQLKENGFDGIEIARYHFDNFSTARIGAAIRRQELDCTLCCGLTGQYSLISEDTSIRQKTLAFLQDAVRVAAELGAQRLVGPLVAPIGALRGRRRNDAEWEWAIAGLQQLGDTLMAHDITLAIEPMNRYQTYFLNTAADAVELCKQVNHPQIGILFDLFHANIEEKCISAAIRAAGSYLKHLHVCENDRGIPGTGHLNWSDVFKALQEIRYDDWVVIESFNFNDAELSGAACVWRDLAPHPEAIAYEGLLFLKETINRLGQSRWE